MVFGFLTVCGLSFDCHLTDGVTHKWTQRLMHGCFLYYTLYIKSQMWQAPDAGPSAVLVSFRNIQPQRAGKHLGRGGHAVPGLYPSSPGGGRGQPARTGPLGAQADVLADVVMALCAYADWLPIEPEVANPGTRRLKAQALTAPGDREYIRA